MLYLEIPELEWYDEEKNEFRRTKSIRIQLEHSLVSLSKWESKWKKPFLNRKEKGTVEETIDYIHCMTITQNVPEYVYDYIVSNSDLVSKVNEYMDDPMTATWFSDKKEGKGIPPRRVVTSELIYCWMTKLQIPFECEKWHLNRLLTLIKVCESENAPPKKMSAKELAQRNMAINSQRLAAAKARRR